MESSFPFSFVNPNFRLGDATLFLTGVEDEDACRATAKSTSFAIQPLEKVITQPTSSNSKAKKNCVTPAFFSGSPPTDTIDEAWLPAIEKFNRKLSLWKEMTLSIGVILYF
ncbi:hypothetical protein LXL04_000678 [Taraxacum kok-saghyz]